MAIKDMRAAFTLGLMGKATVNSLTMRVHHETGGHEVQATYSIPGVGTVLEHKLLAPGVEPNEAMRLWGVEIATKLGEGESDVD